MNAAKITGVVMLLMKTKMTEPAAVSPTSSGGVRRATSATITPFQPDTNSPPNAATTTSAHTGQPLWLKPSSTVVAAEPSAATVSVAVLDTARSAIHPISTRPNTLAACITANTSPATVSDQPRATTR